MHPRNKYCKNPADFEKLGEKYPEFRKYLLPTSSGYTINFKDPRALRELTVSLLREDFGLTVELPLNRLIPTVTLRLNYILWIEDLLQMLPSEELCQIQGIDIVIQTFITGCSGKRLRQNLFYDKLTDVFFQYIREVKIDVYGRPVTANGKLQFAFEGTGASCVYPLLGAKLNRWKFCASEVDEMSHRFACENVKRNSLEENIQVRLVTPDVVLAALVTDCENYDFCMCNPPFFADKSEIVESRSRTGCRPQPNSVCTGSESETVTSGGEVEFVGRIIDDSLKLGTRIKWYTTMLGKKSSLKSVVAKLRLNNISNIITTEFCQGRTMRWGVAWSFLPDVVTKSTPKKRNKSKPLRFSFSPSAIFPNESFSEVENNEQLILKTSERFKEMLNELQIQILSETTGNAGDARSVRLHCSATRNTWANQRRKRREAAGKLRANEASSNIYSSGVSFQNCETDNTLVEIALNVAESEMDHGETMKPDQKSKPTVSTIKLIENLSSNSSLVLTNKSMSDKLYAVGDTGVVVGPKLAPELDELAANASTKHPVIVESKSQNGQTPKSASKNTTLEANTKRKEPPHPESGTHSKRLKSSDIPKNEQLFFEFHATIGAEHVDIKRDGFPKTFLQMEWIDGHEKNSMYQLFQYFQNRLSS